MVDLEYLLQREGEQGDEAFFEEEIAPWIESRKIDRPDPKTMSRSLWLWLQSRKKAVGDEVLPGQAIGAAQLGIGIVLAILMLVAGSGLVMGMLRYDGRTFNIMLLLTMTVGLQWIFLLLGLAGFLTWGIWRDRPFATLAQRFLFRLTEKIARKTLGEQATRWWAENGRMRRLFALPTLQLTQIAGVAFNIGTITAMVGCVLFLAVRFGWETTPENTMNQALQTTTQIFATPFAWAKPEWSPTSTDIENARIDWVDGKPQTPSVQDSRIWYPFFLATMIVWGLLPRLLICGFFGVRQAHLVKSYSFQERAHREWWRDMTNLAIDTPISGPSDGAIAVYWGGLKADLEKLRTYGLQRMRANIAEQVRFGDADLSQDEAALQKVSSFVKKHDGYRVILVAEAWALAPKDFADFHTQLREAIGPDVVIEVLVLGLPKGDVFLTTPKDEEIENWQRTAAELGDPALFVRACNPSGQEPDVSLNATTD